MEKNISPNTPIPIINMGLKREALDFLNDNVEMIPDIICPDCGATITTKQNIVELKASCNDVTLCSYKLSNEKIAETVEQPLDFVGDGAVIFLCLSIDGELNFQWTSQEINEVISNR
jgi:hypothetical protein